MLCMPVLPQGGLAVRSPADRLWARAKPPQRALLFRRLARAAYGNEPQKTQRIGVFIGSRARGWTG